MDDRVVTVENPTMALDDVKNDDVKTKFEISVSHPHSLTPPLVSQ